MSTYAEKVIETLELFDIDALQKDETARMSVHAAARRLLARIETPYDRARRYSFEQPVVLAAIQTFIDLGIWEEWAKSPGGDKSLEAVRKFATVDVQENLLRRLLRLLVADNIVLEVGADVYKPTPFSLALVEKEDTLGMVMFGTHHSRPAGHNLPSFLARTSYHEPADAQKSNFTDMSPENLNFFDSCQLISAHQKSFVDMMMGWTKTKIPWPQFYPMARLIDGADLTTGPLIVDIGGNVGLDLTHALTAHPELPAGALVLQDLPDVITMATSIGVSDKIVTMSNDFFTAQPSYHSRAYFMHAVLHDWPDSAASKILGHLRPAMKKGYSKLLICEIVVPPTGASLIQASMDMMLMSLLSSMERTDAGWKTLLESNGFVITGMWKDPRGIESLLEVELA
ncbi:S-adenosyl-L-methionine-dependent methyltransferase [Xylariales sp. AK1849]|nr:S-adenosyl-L-methionine-dependent methyltransferase [Xylariales sp. AK1849]